MKTHPYITVALLGALAGVFVGLPAALGDWDASTVNLAALLAIALVVVPMVALAAPPDPRRRRR